MSKRRKPHIGSSLDDVLQEEAIYEEVTAMALKKVLARKFVQAMKAQRVTKTTLAKRMGTTRAQLDRILDPENTSMTLMSMVRTAAALGQRLDLDLGARRG